MDGERIWPGRSFPLGAQCDGEGTNFAVYARHADAVELCLFDPQDRDREVRRLKLVDRTGHVFHAYLPGVGRGALYGLRAYGPYEPEAGLRYNPAKLLVDPYARAISGETRFDGPIYGYRHGDPAEDLSLDDRDSAPWMPRSVVVDDHEFDWGGDQRPNTPWHRSVIYEVHVKGFTIRHREVPPELRGTYLGFASPPAIRHLQELGVTAVDLLPVHEYVDDAFLQEKGLSNYWGYSTLGFFAPEQKYARGSRGEQVAQFKELVKALHAAGIEVILDVVYNHTAEGNHLGPTLSLRGLDNLTYYRLQEETPRHYLDVTGTGNSLDTTQPQTLKLVMDSLRYWATEMHVDGFRFDLALTLARDPFLFSETSRFLVAVHQDPVLERVKLIAEPWDLGPGGYAVGGFPVRWSEWNGKYRDAVRRFWKGDENVAGEMGFRLTGSADLYEPAGRKIYASVNFVTAHDGFTLRDLVSYDRKHNEANGEANRDGADDNHSWNCGVEGDTDDAAVLALRGRQVRNLIGTMLLSQGVPMIVAGDELGKTQRGNNNAYCQDNEISWLDWDLDERRKHLLRFVQRMVKFRARHPVLQRRRFFRGAKLWDSSLKDLAWFRPDGTEMTEEDWRKPFARSVAFLLAGDQIATPDERGERIEDDSILILMNAWHEGLDWKLPQVHWGKAWDVVFDTAGEKAQKRESVAASGTVTVEPRSLVVLLRCRDES